VKIQNVRFDLTNFAVRAIAVNGAFVLVHQRLTVGERLPVLVSACTAAFCENR
jgi:hypothetical protein